jgi:hypothetical protein
MATESLFELLDLTYEEVVMREPFFDLASPVELYGRVLLDCARRDLIGFDRDAQALCEALGPELISLGCALMDLRRAQVDGTLSLQLLGALNIDLKQAERQSLEWAAELIQVMGQCWYQLGHHREAVVLYRKAHSMFLLGGAHRKAGLIAQRIQQAGPAFQAQA